MALDMFLALVVLFPIYVLRNHVKQERRLTTTSRKPEMS